MFPLVRLIFKQRHAQSKIPIKRIHFIARFGYLITIYNGIRYVHCEHARNQYYPRPSPGRTERFLLSKYISSVVFFIFCITHNENSTIYQTLVSVLVLGSKELITTSIKIQDPLTRFIGLGLWRGNFKLIDNVQPKRAPCIGLGLWRGNFKLIDSIQPKHAPCYSLDIYDLL